MTAFDAGEYMERIVKHCAGLPNNAVRAQFLRQRIDSIEGFSREAERKAARGEEPKVSAWDYSLLLADLTKELAKYQREAV